jgi:hypothetical protein
VEGCCFEFPLWSQGFPAIFASRAIPDFVGFLPAWAGGLRVAKRPCSPKKPPRRSRDKRVQPRTVLGTITPKDQTINLTAKVITTDTAEIVGAAKATFQTDTTIQQLLSQTAVTTTDGSNASAQQTKAPAPVMTKRFDNLLIGMMELRGLNDQSILITLSFQNLDTVKTIGVAAHSSNLGIYGSIDSSLITSDGTRYFATGADLNGIRALCVNPQSLTLIKPGDTIQASFDFRGGKPRAP